MTGDDAHFMDLYSRQIGTFGIDLMGKLSQLRVVFIGLAGVGIESAKNLILAGPKQVHINIFTLSAHIRSFRIKLY